MALVLDAMHWFHCAGFPVQAPTCAGFQVQAPGFQDLAVLKLDADHSSLPSPQCWALRGFSILNI